MALMFCQACGNQISDQASSCPKCGQPNTHKSGSAGAPRSGRGRSVLKWLFMGAGGLVLLILLFAIIGALGRGAPAGNNSRASAPQAAFQVTDTLSDEECTQLGDYCIRVHCTISNHGEGSGEKEVSAQLYDGNTFVAEKRYNLTLMPSASQRVDFDFPEAELGDEHSYKYRCSTE